MNLGPLHRSVSLSPASIPWRKLSDTVLPTGPNLLAAWFERLSCASLARAAQELLAAPEQDSKAQSTNSAALAHAVAPKPQRDTLVQTISREAMACEWEVLLNQYQ